MSARTKILAGAAALVALTALWFAVPVRELLGAVRDALAGRGAAGVALYVAAFVSVTVALGPTWALTVVAGLVWGLWGVPLAVVSATLGACAVFALGRGAARERVARLVAKDDRFEALCRSVSAERGWKVVALVNLSPVVPFGLQNYVLAVSGIAFAPFALATLVGVVPGAALYVWLGTLGRTEVASGGALGWAVPLGGLAATAAVAWLVARRAKRALAELEGER